MEDGEDGAGGLDMAALCHSSCRNDQIEDYKKCCAPGSCLEREPLYNNRVLLGNWFEERRMYHQLCSRCTGHSIYRTDYLPYCKEDYEKTSCIPPAKYEIIKRAEGVGWNLLRNTEDYCDYLSNYTTTNDLMYNWEIRRANCKYKPKRKWKPIRDNLWLPERDNALPYGNLTQYGFRKAPALPPVPSDWKTYCTDTEYTDRYSEHKFPEAYILCRFAPPKPVSRELEKYLYTRRPGASFCSCDPVDPKVNNAMCRQAFHQNPMRFPKICTVHELRPHPGIQTVYASNKEPYDKLRHPPRTGVCWQEGKVKHSAAMPFKHGVRYKVASVSDGMVLDTHITRTGKNSNINTEEIITWNYGGTSNQLWIATKAEAGWTLSCAQQFGEQDQAAAGLVEPEKCMDQDLSKKRVTHMAKHGGFNQQWYLQEIAPEVNMFVIKNVANNKCLTAHGRGRRVTCASFEPKNPKQHWALTEIHQPEEV